MTEFGLKPVSKSLLDALGPLLAIFGGLKPVLKLFLGPTRALQSEFFGARDASKSVPRALQEAKVAKIIFWTPSGGSQAPFWTHFVTVLEPFWTTF